MSDFTVIPAIDLKGGCCVRLRQGKADQETVYDDDPVGMARRWQDEGARYLHVVDLDGAFNGRPMHTDWIRRIAGAIAIPVEVGGGIRTDEHIEELLSAGVARVVLGTRALQPSDDLARTVERHRDQLVVGIDARDGIVQVSGWTDASRQEAVAFARQAVDFGFRTIIYTDIARDGMLQGVNVDAMAEMCDAVDCPVVASGGVAAPGDVKALLALKRPNLEGVIVGKALYEETVRLPELNALVDAVRMNFTQTVLPNGLRIASTRNDSVQSAAIALWVGVGGRYEPSRYSGISHFIEHLLFKGTRNRTAHEISQTIEGRGGYFNAFTQEESTCYYARIAVDHVEEAFDVLCDMYRNPLFDAREMDKERGVILEEIMMYRDQPHHMVQEMLGEMMWFRHPLGRPLIGTEKIVGGLRRSDVLDFKGRGYVPAGTVAVLAGNLAHEDFVKLARSRLGRLGRQSAPRFRKVTAKTKQERLGMMEKDIEQSHLALGFRVFGRRDRRRFALKLLSVMLGENMSSRLFQVVREKHGLAYAIHSGAQFFDETGILCIQAGLDSDRVEQATSLIVRELSRMVKRPPSRADLQRAKDYATGQLRIGLESTTSQLMWIGENLMGYRAFTHPDRIVQAIEEVTAREVQQTASALLKYRRCSLALIGPDRVSALKPVLDARLKTLA